jgi:superfamily I DNA/RNA helicase
MRPDRIGYLAFTKKAATEAVDRAKVKFGFTDRDLVFFRTIHSLAFRQLGMNRSQVMQREHYKVLGDKLGIRITGHVDMDEGDINYGMSEGDRLIFIDGLARNKMIPLREQWELQPDDDIDWYKLEQVSAALKRYKESQGLYDFTDMLELFVKQGYVPELDVLIIDEAQDLSRLQWTAVNHLIKKAKEVYIGGDDDQSIFRWSGADTDHFIGLRGQVTVLDQSWRVPPEVHELALEISGQISNRHPKTWKPKPGKGNVTWHSDLDTVPMETGNWLLLARNGYMLKQLEEHCLRGGFSFDGGKLNPLRSPALAAIKFWEDMRRGVPLTRDQVERVARYLPAPLNWYRLGGYAAFSAEILEVVGGLGERVKLIWHEALSKISPYEREYFIAARRRGEPLLKAPRIRISTIHGAKGGEADNVLLLTDLAPRTYYEMQDNPDDEYRVFYVGVTRAKESLHLMQPFTDLSFQI